jgi:hypothetical protein
MEIYTYEWQAGGTERNSEEAWALICPFKKTDQ